MDRRRVTLEEMRAIQLGILDSVHAFCMERGLRYSLGGGTLLGAVRHKGYIPWDDDIDIMLPRPDYERFLREYSGTSRHIRVQNYHTDATCYQPFTRLYDDRTLVMEYGSGNAADRNMIRNGVSIDIFPIDGLPPEDRMDDFLARLDAHYRHVWNSTRFPCFNRWQVIKHYIKLLIYPYLNIRMKYSRRESIARYERYLTGYDFDSAEYAGAITGIYGMKEHMPAAAFRTYMDLQFEGRRYKAIAAWDAYLTRHYGDYMQLPPEDKRTSGHSIQAWWK